MKPLIVILISLAGASAVALGGYCLGQAHAPNALSTASTDISEPPDGDDKLAQAIGKFDRRLAALELRQMKAKLAEPQAPAPPPAGGPPSLAPAEMREIQMRKAAAIDRTLKTEPRDRVWASAAESQLQATVEAAVKEGVQFSVKAMKCLTSICEMVLSASSPDQLHGTDLSLIHRISGMGSFDIAPTETEADGSGTITYRLFREGYPRPDEGM